MMSDFKFGVCLGFRDKERMLLAKKAGIDYYEFGFSSFADAEENELKELKSYLDEEKMICPTSNGMFPGEIKLVGKDIDYTLIDEFLDKTAERFAILGGETVVFGSGKARRCPDDYSYEKATEDLIRLCSDHIAPYMRKYALTCAIEPLRSCECNVITTAKRGYEICKAANVAEVKLLIDLFHFDTENEPRSSILDYSDSLAHIHIASATNNRIYPSPDDGTDYKEFFDILREADYSTKRISFEGGYNDFQKDITASLNFLKTL